MAKSGRLEWETIFTDSIGLYSLQPLWRIWPAVQSNSVKKRKIRAITPFEVIQGHRGRYQSKPVCDFLIVIRPNSNWQPIAHLCGVIAAYYSNVGHFAFLSHTLEFLETMYYTHIGLTGKRVVDFLLVLIELLSLDVTAEAVRVKIHRNSAISLQRGQLTQNFRQKETIIFCTDSWAIQLCRWQFSHK